MKLRVPLYSLHSLNYRSNQMTCTNDYKLQFPGNYSIKRQKGLNFNISIRSTIYHQAHREASQQFRSLINWRTENHSRREVDCFMQGFHANLASTRATLESGEQRSSFKGVAHPWFYGGSRFFSQLAEFWIFYVQIWMLSFKYTGTIFSIEFWIPKISSKCSKKLFFKSIKTV